MFIEFLKRIDALIPAGARKTHRERMQSRVIMLMSFGLAALAPVTLVGNLLISDNLIQAILLSSLVAALIFPGLLLIKTGERNLSGFTMALFGLFTTVCLAWWYGGVKAPVSLAVGLVPMAAVAVCDRAYATTMWLLTILSLVLLYVAERSGYLPLSLEQNPARLSVLWLWNQFIFQILGVSIAAFLKGVADHMFGELSESNQQLDEALTATQEARNRAEQASQKYEQLAQRRSEFLANMSHEIRTPMNGVLGMVQLMQHTALNDEQQKYLGTIAQASKALQTILDDILDHSKLEAGKVELEIVPFSVASLTQEVAQLLAPTAARRGNTLTVRAHTPMPDLLLGDPTRVTQILYNLVSNAAKFTHQGRIEILSSYADNLLTLSVTDTGSGIEPEKRELIFAAFTQGEASTSRDYGGTGLGLSIARDLAHLMGGRLEVDSTPGEGSAFTLALPLMQPGIQPHSISLTAGVRAVSAAQSLRVLVVEDDPTNQMVVELMLQQMGHMVTLSGDGAQALEVWESGDFDVILMDWRMPGMDGLQTTEKLRQRESELKRSRIPIIAVTANALSGDREKCLAAGMDDMLPKPIDMQALQRLLEEISEQPVI